MKWIGLTGSLGTGKSTVTKMLRGLGFTVLDADVLAREALAVGTDPYWQVLQDFGHDLKVSAEQVTEAARESLGSKASSSDVGRGEGIGGVGAGAGGAGASAGAEALEIGAIDRRKLAALVFGKPDQLARLEKIIHPFVRARVAEEKARHGFGGEAAKTSVSNVVAGSAPGSGANSSVRSAKEAIRVPAKALFYDVPLLFEKNMMDDFDEVWVVSCSEDLQRERLKSGRGFTDDEIDRRLKHQIPIDEKARMASVVIDNNGDEVQLLKNVEKILIERGLV